MNTKTITRNLKCELTEGELLAYGKEMAEEEKKVEEAEEEKATVTKALGERIKYHSQMARNKAKLINNGYEYREVACDQTFDYPRGLVTITRKDTGDVIEERAMTADERQVGFGEMFETQA